jgi:threonine dehydratase
MSEQSVPSSLAVTADDVRAAATGIAGHVVRTPTLLSHTLSAITGANVWLKFENLQFTSSFKDRGALWRLLHLTGDERSIGVVAMSAGNHAQGVAYHAGRLGIPATIVMPRGTPNVKVRNTEALGARVVLWGDDLVAAQAKADELAASEGLVPVAPFDDPYVIAGQGTVALEMLADAPALDVLVVPVGGGGLLAGMAVAARDVAPDVELIGVETEGYASTTNALAGVEGVAGGTTIAEGIAVARAGRLTLPIIRALVDDVVTVSEGAVEEAVTLLLEIEKTVTEGAGAVGLAAVLADRDRFQGRDVGLVLSGGNIDPRLLAVVVMRGLVRTGRLTRLRIGVPDLPGSLSRVTAIIGDAGGNIVEVVHQRLFSDLSVKITELELAVETRDHEHTEQLVAALDAAGYHVTRS